MVHPGSGFRGTRAGATAGSGSALHATGSPGVAVPRIRVSYWCPSGHQTQPIFMQLPDEQIPEMWDCRRCGGQASRYGQDAASADAGEDGYKTHLEYLKERRSGQDAEDVLAGALEKLRARSVLPDKLLGDP